MAVTATILGFRSDEKTGNLVVDVEYALPDNSRIVNPYHARHENFIGRTRAEMRKWLADQIAYQCDRYLEAHARNAPVNNRIITDHLAAMAGQQIVKDSVVWILTSKKNLITPYLEPENLQPGELPVKRIEIDANGKITESDV